MLINAFMPFVEFGGMWGMKYAFKCLDSSFTRNPYKSKKKSIQLYVDLYTGPEFNIHYRYSTVMNTCFVCMMYGTAIPLLYPIGLLTFINLLVLEKLLVCYYYK